MLRYAAKKETQSNHITQLLRYLVAYYAKLQTTLSKTTITTQLAKINTQVASIFVIHKYVIVYYCMAYGAAYFVK